MKYIEILGQIVESEYKKSDGTIAKGYTLSLLLPGSTILVKPVNSKNYGAILGLVDKYPDSVVTFKNKEK